MMLTHFILSHSAWLLLCSSKAHTFKFYMVGNSVYISAVQTLEFPQCLRRPFPSKMFCTTGPGSPCVPFCSELVNCNGVYFIGLSSQFVITKFPRPKGIVNLSNVEYMPARLSKGVSNSTYLIIIHVK